MKNIQSLEPHHPYKRERSSGSTHRNGSLRGMAVHWPNGRCNPYSDRGDTSTPWRTLLLEHEPRLVRPTEQMPVDSQIRKWYNEAPYDQCSERSSEGSQPPRQVAKTSRLIPFLCGEPFSSKWWGFIARSRHHRKIGKEGQTWSDIGLTRSIDTP